MKRYFCESCGTELKWSRKALKNKGIIVELITPHECDNSNLQNIQDADKPLVEQVTFIPKEKPPPESPLDPFDRVFSDKRNEKFLKSSAPPGILRQVGSRNESED